MSFATAFVSSPASIARGSFVPGKDAITRSVPSRNVAVKSKRVEPRAVLSLGGFTIPFFPRTEKVALPQYDKENADERAKAIAEAQSNYQWTQEGISDASLIKSLPFDEYPRLGWLEDLARVVIRVASNSVAIRANEFGEDIVQGTKDTIRYITSTFFDITQKILRKDLDDNTRKGIADEIYKLFKPQTDRKGSSFQEYKDDFIVIKPDTIANKDQFLRDDIFGWYRVAGPSPMVITKLEGSPAGMFPDLTDDIVRGIPEFENDSLKEMQNEDRLFYVDYKEYNGVGPGTLPDGTVKEGQYLYASTCLLAVPKNPDARTTVLPIAIRCGQGNEYPMYTSNPKHTDPTTWFAAKVTVQVADGNRHETEFHLGRTHLVMEVFVCATYRALAPTHPLHKLLSNHFYGTAFINQAAVDSLINPGGIIDQITAQQIDLSKELSARAINGSSVSFNEWMPDKELANRGVLNASKLKFPYRDDALKLWGAINEWVDAYVRAYYKSDNDVRNDTELANWCEEVVNPKRGNLSGFGETPDGKILTVSYLVRAISMVIFTASVQHAAVNFPQATMMQFVPSMPLSGFAPPPTSPKPFKNMDDLVENMLPNMEKAQVQMNTAELIGVLKYSKLGEYGDELEFAPDEVDEALQAFQERLSDIGAEIQQRNTKERAVGLPVYNHLVPRNIPQSINI